MESLGSRYLELIDETADLDELLLPVVKDLASQLLERIEIGVEVAGKLFLTGGDNPDRMKSDAAFVMLFGVSPVPASSAMTQRQRLNRVGNRPRQPRP